MTSMNKDYMLKTRPKINAGVSFPSPARGSSAGRSGSTEAWEVRPGGMFVQKRSKDSTNHVPNIKVIVKYGSSYHEIILSSQANFGELKKMLRGATGLHPEDQKLMFREKERDSKSFLDVVGVKDGSKMVLIEDQLSKERRCVESRKNNANLDAKAYNDIAAVRCEVDKLEKQVASIELEVNGCKKVEDTVLSNMIESLMIELIKLDGISADGDVKLQRRMQVNRVQKYIEILDVLKVRNSSIVCMHQQPKILKGQLPTFQEQRKQGVNFFHKY